MKNAWTIMLIFATFISIVLIWARNEAKKLQKTKKELKIERRLIKYGIRKKGY